MSRWVQPKRLGIAEKTGEGADGALARIAKFIPGEVVSAYTLLLGLLAAVDLSDGQSLWAALGLAGLFVVVTIVYVAQRAPEGAVRRAHLWVSPLAFLAWAYPISSGFLGPYFLGLVSFFGQAVVIALSLFVQPEV